MRAIATIFLTNSLCAILDHIDQNSDLNPDQPGLLKFKETLIERIHQPSKEYPARLSDQSKRAA
jgi:hypothetical protein